MQNQNTSPPETTFTGGHVYTVWSQYQSAVRNKQMGRGSRRFRGVKTIIFKGKVVNKWLPVRTTLADLQRLGFEGSWQDEYSFPNSPIFYLYLAGFCVVGGLVIVDVISRFQQQPAPVGNEIVDIEIDPVASTKTHPTIHST